MKTFFEKRSVNPKAGESLNPRGLQAAVNTTGAQVAKFHDRLGLNYRRLKSLVIGLSHCHLKKVSA